MTTAEIKDALVLAVLAFTLWRVVRLEMTFAKSITELEHQIDLLRVYKEDKR